VLQEIGGDSAQLILVATGSEVSLCVDSAKTLASEGVKVRNVL
jgi:transketolase